MFTFNLLMDTMVDLKLKADLIEKALKYSNP